MPSQPRERIGPLNGTRDPRESDPSAKGMLARIWTGPVRIATALILVALVLSVVDLSVVASALVQSDLGYLVPVIGLALADRYVMAHKWAVLLQARGVPLRTTRAFGIYLVSSFAGNFLPSSIGADAVRLANTTMGVGRMDEVTASILLEKALGLLAMAVLASAGLAVLVSGGQEQFNGLFVGVSAITAGLLVALVISFQESLYRLAIRTTARWSESKPVQFLASAHAAYVDSIRHRRALGYFFIVSVIEHGIIAVINLLAALALGWDIPLIYFIALVPVSGVLEMIPVSIGGLGVAEGAYVVLFGLAGVSPEDAVALALYLRITGMIALAPGGVLLVNELVGRRESRQER